jgi:transmembrane sensor
MHDDSRPFTVHAGAGDIRDVGTIFNVESRNGLVAVAVLEGEVSVTGDITRSPATNLVASQGISYDATGLLAPIASVQSEDVLAWRDWKLVFHDQPLGEALARLSPYYDVNFEITDPTLSNLRISGSFQIADLNLFLKTLATAFPIRAKILDAHHIKLQRVVS